MVQACGGEVLFYFYFPRCMLIGALQLGLAIQWCAPVYLSHTLSLSAPLSFVCPLSFCIAALGLSICLSVYLSICLTVSLSLCLSVSLSICLTVSLFSSLCFHLSVLISLFSSLFLFLILSLSRPFPGLLLSRFPQRRPLEPRSGAKHPGRSFGLCVFLAGRPRRSLTSTHASTPRMTRMPAFRTVGCRASFARST